MREHIGERIGTRKTRRCSDGCCRADRDVGSHGVSVRVDAKGQDGVRTRRSEQRVRVDGQFVGWFGRGREDRIFPAEPAGIRLIVHDYSCILPWRIASVGRHEANRA